MNRNTFTKELERIVDISKAFDAKKVILFGSCLEDIHAARDIDIAVSGIKSADFFKYYGKVSMELDDDVDIVDLDDMREYLCGKILSQGRVLYEKAV